MSSIYETFCMYVYVQRVESTQVSESHADRGGPRLREEPAAPVRRRRVTEVHSHNRHVP